MGRARNWSASIRLACSSGIGRMLRPATTRRPERIAAALAAHLRVWVLNEAGTVWPVDSVTDRAGSLIGLRGCERFASSIAITPDGRTVLVACAHVLFTISAATGRVRVAAGTGPGVADQVVVAPNGKRAYVASGNTLVPITVSTGKAAKRSWSPRGAMGQSGLP
jgi:DNA-binding beta-propeller fold protein YncE